MKKTITLCIIVFMGLSAFSADITEGSKLYLSPNTNWKADGARFAAYFFGAGGNAWASMTAVAGETDLYEVIAPMGSWENVIFCRMNPGTSTDSWGNKWNQTNDLTYDGTNNRYTITEGTWDNGGGIWSVYTAAASNEPAVNLSIARSKVFIDETIAFNATSENVTTPVYLYYVKLPGNENYETAAITSPYQPTAVGTYTIKVSVSGEEGSDLTSSEKTVSVNIVPAPITIKVRIPETWTNPHFYNWNADVSGNFVAPTQEDGWYMYTFTRMDVLNFIVVNGNDWSGGDSNQTINVENITESTCYQLNSEGEDKKDISIIDCSQATSNDEATQRNLIFIQDNVIRVTCSSAAHIELHTIGGQLIHSAQATNNLSYPVNVGIYLIRINGEIHKVIVR